MFGNDSKYIVVAGPCGPMVILFNNYMKHSDMVAMSGFEVLSAGFFYIDSEGKALALGESISLGVKADPARDSKLIDAMIFQDQD